MVLKGIVEHKHEWTKSYQEQMQQLLQLLNKNSVTESTANLAGNLVSLMSLTPMRNGS